MADAAVSLEAPAAPAAAPPASAPAGKGAQPAEAPPALTPDEAALKLLQQALPEGDEERPASKKVGDKKADPEKEEAKEERPKDRVFAALKRKSEAVKADRARFFAEKADVEQQVIAKATELRQREERLSRWEQAEKVAKENPLKALETLGISYESVAGQMLRGDNPDDKFAALQKEIAETRRILLDREEREQRAQLAHQQTVGAEQARSVFLGAVTQNESRFPTLCALDPAEIGRYGDLMADQMVAQGRPPRSLDEIAEALESHFSAQYERMAAKRSGAKSSDAAREPAPVTPAKPEVPRARTQTISNRVSAESSGKTRPMTEKERTAEALRVLTGERLARSRVGAGVRHHGIRSSNVYERSSSAQSQIPAIEGLRPNLRKQPFFGHGCERGLL